MGEIESLMQHVSPQVHETVRTSVLQTLVNMIADHRDTVAEIEQVERELGSEEFGKW